MLPSPFSCNLLVPFGPFLVVVLQVVPQQPEEDMIVDPFGDGSESAMPHDVDAAILQVPVRSWRGARAECALRVDGEGIII